MEGAEAEAAEGGAEKGFKGVTEGGGGATWKRKGYSWAWMARKLKNSTTEINPSFILSTPAIQSSVKISIRKTRRLFDALNIWQNSVS